MNLVELVFDEMKHNAKRTAALRKRRMTLGTCVECGHHEHDHVWTRDAAPCTRKRCQCPSFWNGSE